MLIDVFGKSSHDNGNKGDTSLLEQKPYLRTNFSESNLEEHIHLKNQNKKLKVYPILLTCKMLVLKIMLIICSTFLAY